MEEIVLTQEQCARIKTSKDINDIYAYFERHYEQGENEADSDFLDRLPTYLFDTTKEEQERIEELVAEMNYTAGDYDLDNVERIIGKESAHRKYTIELSDNDLELLRYLEWRLVRDYNNHIPFNQAEEDRLILGNILDQVGETL